MRPRLLLLLLLGLAGSATAQERSNAAPAAPAQPLPLAQEMFKVGAISCAATAHQLASLFSNGKEISLLQVPKADPDHNLLGAMLVKPSDKGTALISMSFAPNQASGCGASYQGILYTEDTCAKAAEKNFPNVKTEPLAKTGVMVGALGPKVQVILAPAGKGCLMVTSELVR